MKKLLFLVITVTLMLLISTKVFAEDAFPANRVAAQDMDPNMEKAAIDSQRGGFQGAITLPGGSAPAGTVNFPGTPPVNKDAGCALCGNNKRQSTPADKIDGSSPGSTPTDAGEGDSEI